MTVSIYQNGYAFEGYEVSVEPVLHAVWSGRWRQKIEILRRLLTVNKKFYDARKIYLPAVTFNGTFIRRVDEGIKQYSGIFCADMDYCDPEQMKEILKADPHIYSMFASPSDNGLKVLIKVDNSADNHIEAFRHITDYFNSSYGIEIDKSCKNLSRLCFISYDPKLFFNRISKVFNVDVPKYHVPPIPVERNFTAEELKDVPQQFDLCYRLAQGYYPYYEGNRNNHIFFLSCLLNERGIYLEEAMDFIQKKYLSLPEDCAITVKHIYSKKADKFNTHKQRTNEPKIVRLG
jgi:hypothetical protein